MDIGDPMTEQQLHHSSLNERADLSVATESPSMNSLQAPFGDLDEDPIIETRKSKPPRLLLTLLGDYWWQCTEQLPSAALVALLAEFGVSDVAARAALSRLVQHGLLVTSKHGRHTFYGLSDRATHILDEGVRRIFSFGLSSRSWDGTWSMVAFSIPEKKRQLRYILRDRLRWLGFSPLYDGLWVSPYDRLSEAADQLAELSITTITMLRANVTDNTPAAGSPQRAWNLDALREQYQQFIAAIQQVRTHLKKKLITPEEALKMRTQTMDLWRSFPALDPDLPDELLPPDWPRKQARQLFITTYAELGPLAQYRVQQILARYAPDLARAATCHHSDAFLLLGNNMNLPDTSSLPGG
jgi:phenylacetic acid degradation operon negative regulatory protein